LKLSREVKTGILALGAIALFILGYNFLAGSNLLNSSRTFYVKYSNVEGLAASAPVTINGLQVGKVQSIDFANQSGELVVTFSVDKDFKFSKNSMVQIYSSGFIGGNNLGIVPKYDANNLAKDQDTLMGEYKKGLLDGVIDTFEPLEESFKNTLVKLDSVLAGVNDILDAPTRQKLKSTISDLSTTVASFKGASRNMNTLLAENKDKLSNTFGNLEVTSKNFAQLSDSLAQIETGKMVKDIEGVTSQLNNLMTQIQSGEGSVGKLLNDEKLYDNLSGASLQLEQLLEDMKLNPKRYVHFSLFGKRAKTYEQPKDTL